MSKEQRLFIGMYPTGLVYADSHIDKDGDYERLAYLNYETLVLELEPERRFHTLDRRLLLDQIIRSAERWTATNAGACWPGYPQVGRNIWMAREAVAP